MFQTHGKEALDLALILGSFEQNVALFFQGNGVYQLVQNQALEQINQKDYLATFAALPFYDVEQIFICQEDIAQRKINTEQLLPHAEILSRAAFQQKLAQFDVCLRF